MKRAKYEHGRVMHAGVPVCVDTRVMARRGFTLLELMLAVLVGSMVVVLAIALLTSIERSNSMISARTEQTADMQTVRLVMNRAFNSILAAQPLQNQNRGPAVAQATAEGEAAPPPVPERMQAPRVVLELDSNTAGVMERRDADGSVVTQAPQRLEIVLLDSPVPSASNVDPFVLARVAKREARRQKSVSEPADAAGDEAVGTDPAATDEPAATGGATGEAAAEENAVEDGDLGVRAIRGVFELLPQQLTVAQREQLRESVRQKPIYELWWRPVASPKTAREWTAMSRGERVVETARLGKPMKLASGLTFARWRMFDDRAKRTEYEATQYNQLPAYAEFEAETTAGIRHQWLFEIGWAIGPETSAERDANKVNRPVPGADAAGAQGGTPGGAEGGAQSGKGQGGEVGTGRGQTGTGGKGESGKNSGKTSGKGGGK